MKLIFKIVNNPVYNVYDNLNLLGKIYAYGEKYYYPSMNYASLTKEQKNEIDNKLEELNKERK